MAQHGENLILFHSSWGDGSYPLIGSYGAGGELVAVHIDFFIVPDPEDEEQKTADEQPCLIPAWTGFCGRGWAGG